MGSCFLIINNGYIIINCNVHLITVFFNNVTVSTIAILLRIEVRKVFLSASGKSFLLFWRLFLRDKSYLKGTRLSNVQYFILTRHVLHISIQYAGVGGRLMIHFLPNFVVLLKMLLFSAHNYSQKFLIWPFSRGALILLDTYSWAL